MIVMMTDEERDLGVMINHSIKMSTSTKIKANNSLETSKQGYQPHNALR